MPYYPPAQSGGGSSGEVGPDAAKSIYVSSTLGSSSGAGVACTITSSENSTFRSITGHVDRIKVAELTSGVYGIAVPVPDEVAKSLGPSVRSTVITDETFNQFLAVVYASVTDELTPGEGKVLSLLIALTSTGEPVDLLDKTVTFSF